MECQDAIERLSADLDAELPAAEAASLRLHLRSCDGCSRKRALLEITRRAYRSVASESPEEFVDAAVRLRPARVGIGWWIAAATAVVPVLALVFLKSPETPRPIVASVAVPMAAARQHEPGWNEGRWDLAADCGLSGATECVIDSPCAHAECSSVVPMP